MSFTGIDPALGPPSFPYSLSQDPYVCIPLISLTDQQVQEEEEKRREEEKSYSLEISEPPLKKVKLEDGVDEKEEKLKEERKKKDEESRRKTLNDIEEYVDKEKAFIIPSKLKKFMAVMASSKASLCIPQFLTHILSTGPKTLQR